LRVAFPDLLWIPVFACGFSVLPVAAALRRHLEGSL
jgi:hypothetical protein